MLLCGGRSRKRIDISHVWHAPDQCGVTIAGAYIVGGFIPPGPYIALQASMALPASVVITLLAIFGYTKGHSRLHLLQAPCKRS